jgi:orotate phosphoribosyltransferase
VVLALDRQERGQGALSAVQEVQQLFKLPVASILQLDGLIAHLGAREAAQDAQNVKLLAAIRQYRADYGVG